MTTRWPYWANIVVTDKELGNLFASKIDPDDGSHTFGAIKLRRPEHEKGTVDAYASSVPLTIAGRLIFDEFAGPGPYSNLLLLGLSADDIAAAKTDFRIEHGNREFLEDRLPAYILSLGYTV